MKLFITLMSFVLSIAAQAQNVTPITSNVPPVVAPEMEAGRYIGVDVETGTLNADVTLNADKTLVFKLKSADFEVPEPGCTGIYEQVGNDVLSDVTCPLDFLPQTKVRLDITQVNHDSVRTADGVEVPVFVEAIGEEAIIFKMKIVEPVITPVP